MNIKVKSVYELPLVARYTEDGKAYFMSGFYLTRKEDALKMIKALNDFYSKVSEEDIKAENQRLADEISADRYCK